MGNSIVEWRVTVGGFYNRCQRLRLPYKVSINFILHLNLCYFIKIMKQLLSVAVDAKTKFLNECFYYILIQRLLVISGDVEINPGPNDTSHCSSVLHSNIRSIRNKLNYIKDNFLEFNVICFTETHLDANVSTNDVLLIQTYDSPYRKDRTNNGGGILVYIDSHLVHERVTELDHFWDESIRFKIRKVIYIYLEFAIVQRLVIKLPLKN